MIDIQKILVQLFDYQRFAKNKNLAELISVTESSYENCRELSDDQVDVWAAGDPNAMHQPFFLQESDNE